MKPATLPMPATPATHLMRVMEDLIAVMDAEPELMVSHRTAEHKELLKRKQRLLLDYEQDMKALALSPGYLKTMSKDLTAQLTAGQKRLEESVNRNATALKVAMIASQNLLDAVIDVVRKETTPGHSYRNPTDQFAGGMPLKTVHQPVALNRTV